MGVPDAHCGAEGALVRDAKGGVALCDSKEGGVEEPDAEAAALRAAEEVRLPRGEYDADGAGEVVRVGRGVVVGSADTDGDGEGGALAVAVWAALGVAAKLRCELGEEAVVALAQDKGEAVEKLLEEKKPEGVATPEALLVGAATVGVASMDKLCAALRVIETLRD